LVVLRGPGGNHTTQNRRGEVVVSSGGKDITLTEPGTGVLVSNADEEPSNTFVVTDELYNYFNRRLRTRPTRSGNFKPFEIDEGWFTPKPSTDPQHSTIFNHLNSIEDTDWPAVGLSGVGG